MTHANKIKLMRSHAVMAGITSLAHQYPQHVPLEARPSPASLYLYDSILLAGKHNVHAAFAGLCRFVIALLDDLEQGKILPTGSAFLSPEDGEVLASIRKIFIERKVGKVELLLLQSQWSYPRGKADEFFRSYQLRTDPVGTSQQFIRLGVAALLRMMAELDDAEPDWWHRLGLAIHYFGFAYMAQAWAASGEPIKSEDALSASEYRALYDARAAMLWEHQQELFVRLGDYIGVNAGQLPLPRPQATTAVLLGAEIPRLEQLSTI